MPLVKTVPLTGNWMLFYRWGRNQAGGDVTSAGIWSSLHKAVVISLADVKHSSVISAAQFGIQLSVAPITVMEKKSLSDDALRKKPA
jgi:hypothetical protein